MRDTEKDHEDKKPVQKDEPAAADKAQDEHEQQLAEGTETPG